MDTKDIPVIELDNIKKSFITGVGEIEVLKGISFKIHKSEFVSVMGPSGSGKSTCMNIVGCLDNATSGKYILDGKDVSEKTSNELADIRNRKLGFVFQNFNLLGKRNLVDNVALPLIYRGVSKRERNEKAIQILEKVGLKGFETYVPNQLSGGMKQRVAIARALIGDPEVILADEPTGNLDSKTTAEIMDLFEELNSNLKITIVMITHEEDLAKRTKRIINIKDGKVSYDGEAKKFRR
ncbi:MAG: ABC transporter ATP-binding protein [Rickettsiales bacterium]|jgi:putative ABC transport system ATP-binding protein|nr:ABC transporter ATP-binding protein [Rickettsiales bacterium]